MDIKWVGANSNNYSKGRQGNVASRIVVHWIVGSLESADATFNNPTRQASAHYGVGDNDVHQYVKEEDTAWHCGDWLWNLKSIGIEHEGGPDIPITDETYKTSATLIRDICSRHNIPIDRDHITPHRQYSATACPGDLNLDRLIELAKGDDMEIEDLKKQIEKLDEELDEMRLSRNEWRSKFKTLEDIHEAETTANRSHIESLQITLSEINQQVSTLQNQYAIAVEEKNVLAGRVEPLEAKLDELTAEVEKLELALAKQADINKQLSEENLELKEDIKGLKAQLKKKLKDFGRWELIKALFY